MKSKSYTPPFGTNGPRELLTIPHSTVAANMIAALRPFHVVASPATENETLPTPNIFTVAPEWVALRARDAELANREDKLFAEAAKIKQEIHKLSLGDWTTNNRMPDENAVPPAPSKAVTAARKLLGKLAPDAPEEVKKSAIAPPALISRSKHLGEELDVIHEARKILAPQIRRAFLDGSRRLREMIKPEFDQLQCDVFSALFALGDAILAYDGFMASHRNMALSLLRPIVGPVQSRSVLNIGDPRDRTSPLRLFLQQAIDAGSIKEAQIPPTWLGFDLSKAKRWADPT
jgi:hypothetical protein